MKKIIITAALLFALQIVKAQFLTDNMRWTYIETNIFEDIPDKVYSDRIEGDTIITGLTYFKVYNENNIFFAALREDTANKIFFYDFFTNREYLLYDFEWENGKELLYQWRVYDSVLGDYPLISYAVIDKMDSVQLLDGLYYKCLRDGTSENRINVIQGIGDLKGFFLYPLRPSNGSQIDLLCFHKGNQLIYLNPDYEDCTAGITSNIEELSKDKIKIFPNPTSNNLTIEIDKPYSQIKIEIRDVQGRILYQKETLENPIRLDNWSAGIYMVKLQVDNKVITKKIMLE